MPRGRRQRRRGRGGKNNEALTTGLIVAGTAILAIFLGYMYFTMPEHVKSDPETLCPDDPANVPHLEVVLVERNRRILADTGEFNPLSPSTVEEVSRIVVNERLDELPKHARIELYEVNYETSRLYDPIKVICNPGNGSDLDEFRGNPDLARRRYHQKFRDPFEEKLKEVTQWSPEYRYDLMTSLEGVARLPLANPEYSHARKSITVISDFLVPQNFQCDDQVCESHRQVSASSKPSSFELFIDSGGGILDFRRAEVTMIYLWEKYLDIPDVQGSSHVGWWERFFDSQNGSVVSVRRVGERR